MTKEELKQEAEEYANNLVFVFETDIVQRIVRERVRLALIDVLESREKQIQIDAEQIRALQKQNGELTDKVTELEVQIEKMKCCQNCLHLCARCELGIDGCYVCSKWELRR